MGTILTVATGDLAGLGRGAAVIGGHQVYPVRQQRKANLHTNGNVVTPRGMRRDGEEQRRPLRTIDGHGQCHIFAELKAFNDRA